MSLTFHLILSFFPYHCSILLMTACRLFLMLPTIALNYCEINVRALTEMWIQWWNSWNDNSFVITQYDSFENRELCRHWPVKTKMHNKSCIKLCFDGWKIAFRTIAGNQYNISKYSKALFPSSIFCSILSCLKWPKASRAELKICVCYQSIRPQRQNIWGVPRCVIQLFNKLHLLSWQEDIKSPIVSFSNENRESRCAHLGMPSLSCYRGQSYSSHCWCLVNCVLCRDTESLLRLVLVHDQNTVIHNILPS